MKKLIRITTIPLSLEKLLEGQLTFMQGSYEVAAISAEKERLELYGTRNGVATKHIELTRKITPVKDIKAVYTLYRYLKKEKPLIVHTHTPKAGIVGMLAARLARVPLRLHTVAGLPLMEARGLKRIVLNAVEKLTYYTATNVYPNSKGLYDFIVAEKFTKEKKLKVLGNGSSNGIDTVYFNPVLYDVQFVKSKRQELGILPDTFVFIFVGRLVSDKGVNELVQAFKEVQRRHQNVSLLLVGPLEEELDPLLPETSEEIKNNDQILSVGYQKDVRSYFAVADALVFPSYREGFPNVVMQAGAMGLPAIVSDINGCNEIIEQDVNGIIIPVKNEKATQEAMEKLLYKSKCYKDLQVNARNVVVKKYDRQEMWEHILKEYVSLEAKL